MELKTERLTLRKLLITDVEHIHVLLCLPETDRFNTFGIPATIDVTKQLVSEWLMAHNELPVKKYVFCVEYREQEFIGLVGINMGKHAYRNAEIWYKFHLNHWNQGFATEAVNRIVHFCFTDLNLHRVEAGCAVENVASRRVLEKAGMTKEGYRRKLLPIRGAWVDSLEFAILDTDFDQAKSYSSI